jgi:hypothetical protein
MSQYFGLGFMPVFEGKIFRKKKVDLTMGHSYSFFALRWSGSV